MDFQGSEGIERRDCAMDNVYDQLTARARTIEHQNSLSGDTTSHRTVIILAGPPGSGKSKIAAEVVRRLNQSSKDGQAIVLPMDGFHLTRATLQSMPNSEEAFKRRGVHWTYNADGVFELIKSLHETRSDRSVIHLAPCFDHALKDPVADEIKITPDVGIVIVEGNWLLYDEIPWSNIHQVVDDTWFVDVDRDLALMRVAKRHVESGIESSWEEAVRRASNNDMVNGDLVRAKLITPAVRVQSSETQQSA